MNDKDAKKLLSELADLKKLIILQLFGQGFKQKQIAQMLDISEASMSRMMPKGLSKFAGKRSDSSNRTIESVDD